MQRITLGLACLFCLVGGLTAQVLPFRNYLPDDGLASSQVLAIYQDHQGYLWFGCTGGLSRFDSRHFITYGPGEGVVLSSVRAITEDSAGTLWIGTQRGPCRYDFNADRFVLARDLQAEVRAFAHLAGQLYCVLDNGALYRLAPGGDWHIVTPATSLGNPTAMISDGQQLYCGNMTGQLLAIRPDGPAAAVAITPVGFRIHRLQVTASGDLLLATDNGLYRYRPATRALEGPLYATGGERLFTISTGRGKELWLGGPAGVYLHQGNVPVRHFTHLNGLSGIPVWISFTDREGSVWFGTNHGVSRLSNLSVEIFDTRAGLPGRSVISIAWDSTRQRLWLGTTQGLFGFRDDRFTPFPADADVFAKYYVWAILPEADGTLWLGTEGGGLARWDGRRLHWITRRDGLPGNEVMDLRRDIAGRLWIATRQGLACLDAAGLHAYTRANGLPADYVRCLLTVPGDTGIYLGTIGAGLVHFDGTRFRRLTLPGQVSLESVYDLLWQDQRIWMATNYGVFTRDESGRIKEFGLSAGLPDLSATTFLPAGPDRIWIGTDHGAALLNVNSGRVSKILSRANGLPGNEFTTHNCCAVDGQGHFWFGLFGGAARLQPEAVATGSDSLVTPLIRLEKVEIGRSGGRHSVRRSLRNDHLGKDVRSLKFYYNVLWFSDPENIHAACELVGFDEGYSPPSRTFQKEYTNLPAGDYRFDVQIYRGDKPLSHTTLATFTVPRTMWQNPLFHLLAILAAALAIFVGVRWRYRAIENEKERLAEVARTATMELEKKNTLLSRLAVTDELTGLYNRRFIQAALHKEMRRICRARSGESLSLLMVDIDHFKRINDRWGHPTGDKVLQHVARCLRASLRATDICARFGGEEFLLVLPQTDHPGAVQVAEKIRRTIAEYPVEKDGHLIGCTVSIGVVAISPPLTYSDDLVQQQIRLADAMMYSAKQQGRNRTVVMDVTAERAAAPLDSAGTSSN